MHRDLHARRASHGKWRHVMIGMTLLRSRERPKIASKPPEAHHESWNRFSLTALGRNQPCWYLDLGLQPPELWGNTFLLFKHPAGGIEYFVRRTIQWRVWGLPRCQSGKESACQCRRCKRHGLCPWVGKIPWRRKWQTTPVLLPGESHGQRSLTGYSPLGCRESDMTEYPHIQWGISKSSCLGAVLLLTTKWFRPLSFIKYYIRSPN